MDSNISELSAFIWKIADILREDSLQSEYADVILQFVVLRTLDSVLEPTKDKGKEVNRTCRHAYGFGG